MNKNTGRRVNQLVNNRRGERLKFKIDRMGSRTICPIFLKFLFLDIGGKG